MYDIRITLPTTQDERATVYALLKYLEHDYYLKNKIDTFVLKPLLQRILDKSASGVMIDPLNHTEYDEYDLAKDIEQLISKYSQTKL